MIREDYQDLKKKTIFSLAMCLGFFLSSFFLIGSKLKRKGEDEMVKYASFIYSRDI